MYPTQFAEYLRDWLTDSGHPGIDQVRTCADLGRWEQPVGVAATLTDGWTLILQCVGTYPPGGAAGDDPDSPRPAPFAGSWEDRDDYKTARAAFAEAAVAYDGPVSRRPQASVTALLAAVLDIVKRADHPKLAHVEVSRTRPDTPDVLRVTCTDKSMIYGLAAGYIAPGNTDLAHKAHEIPKEWC